MQEKASYKDDFAALRPLKQEIEHLQMLLEQSRTKLQRDFEQWLGLMLRQQQAASAATAGALLAPSSAASPRGAPQRPHRWVSVMWPHWVCDKVQAVCAVAVASSMITCEVLQWMVLLSTIPSLCCHWLGWRY